MANERILVVDDQPLMALTCAEILAEAGYQTHTANNGRQALERLEKERFDLLLADLKMPGVDGLAVLRRGRELHPDLVAIMMTSYATLENAIEALRAGAKDFLLKPFDPNDLLCCVGETLADTQREATLKALRHREQLLSSIYDHVSDMLFYLTVEPDDGFRFISVNKAFLRATGLVEEQVIGKDFRQVIPEPAHDLVLGKYREAIRERRTATWEEISVYPTGKKMGEVSVTPVFDAAGHCTHLVGAVHDVTEHRLTKEKIHALEARYRALFENSLDAVLLTSPDGSIQAANPAACRMFERTEAEIVQAGRAGVVDTSDPRLAHLLAERVRTGKVLGELTMLRRDGTPFPAEISTCVFQDSDGVERTSMIVRDITERKRAQEEVEQHNREMTTLLEVSQALTATLDMDTVLQTSINGAVSLMKLGSGAIYLLEGDTLVLRATTPPLPPQFPEEFRKAPLSDHPHIHRALATGQSVIVPDTNIADFTPAERAISESRGLRSIVYVPLMARGQAVGVWILAPAEKPRAFCQAEIDLVRTLSTQAALVISNAGLYAAARQELEERKRTEEIVRARELAYRELADSISDVFFAFDDDLRYTYWNKASETLTGISAQQAMGKSLLDIFPDTPENRQAQKIYEEVRETKQPQTFVTKTQLGGNLYHFEISAYPAQRGISVYVKDITQRRLAEEELCHRVEELAALNRGARLLMESLEPAIVAENITRTCVQIFGARLAWLLRAEPDGSASSLAHFPTNIQYPAQARIRWDDTPLGQGPTGRAVRSGEPVILADLTRAPSIVVWRDAALKEGFLTSATFPLASSQQSFGALNLYSDQPGFFSKERIEFFQTYASQATVTLQNAHLFEQVSASSERLRTLARYLQDAQETERTRVARELHDELGQALTVLKMDSSRLASRLPQEDEKLHQQARAMAGLIDGTIDSVRRVAAGLRPGLLDRLGLAAAIEWQAEEVAGRTGLRIELDLKGGGRDLDPDLTTAAFRVFQEALTNVVRHASASRVQVTLRAEDNQVLLQVKDNGQGIASSEIAGPRSWGITGMRERAQAWGGEVQIEGAPGQGTTLTLYLPRQNKEGE